MSNTIIYLSSKHGKLPVLVAPHLEVQAGDILAELVGPYLAVLVVGPSLAVLVVVPQAVSTQVLQVVDTQVVGVELHLVKINIFKSL